MILLLADVNIQGHIEFLVKRMQAEPWLGFWNYLELSCASFADLGLTPRDSDAVIWHRCQQRRAFLLTNNRNDDGPDSLENTISTCNTPQSLPVFTIGETRMLPAFPTQRFRAIIINNLGLARPPKMIFAGGNHAARNGTE